MSKTLVVITNGNFFASRILSGLFDRYPDQVAVILVSGDYKGHSGFLALSSLAKATTTPYLIYKLLTTVFLKAAQYISPSRELSVQVMAQRRSIPIFTTPSIRLPGALDWLQAMSPELIVSVSCPQLIGRKMLAASRLGGINIHSSLLPNYAGLAPYYWVLSNGEKYTGTTVHHMSLKFDTGNVLVQRRVSIQPGESAFHLFWRLAEVGRSALTEGVFLALQGSAGRPQDLSGYLYYSHPTTSSYRTLRRNGHTLVRLKDMFSVLKSPQMKDSQIGEDQSIDLA